MTLYSEILVIIKGVNVSEVPQSLGITVGLKLLHGEYPKLIERIPKLKDVSTLLQIIDF